MVDKFGLMIIVVFAAMSFGNAQVSNVAPNGNIRCYTTENELERKRQNPKLQTDAEFESWMARELAAVAQNPSPRAPATRVIPTVVHIVYSNAASTDNISDAQVMSQIDILNEDFGRTNPDTVNTPVAFQPVAVDSDLEFCLAQIDPMGNPTTGINRVQIAGSPYTTGFVEGTIKPTTQWDPTQYFNVWVCNISGGVLGYAQFPEAGGLAGIGTGNGAANTDGVVLLHSSVGAPPANPFGGPYNLGRTATHEVGHWLGLRHIWGDGGCAVDDFCADTPGSDGSNFGCATAHVSCGTVDMVQNYMDYSDDACMNIFTADQKARMDIVMTSSIRRASLLTSTVCNLTPEITYVNTTTTMSENSSSGTSGCRGFQDIDIALRIGGPPSGAATVTLTTVGGSALVGVDYDILTGVVVFPNGVTGNQTFRIRVYDDAAIEANENLTIGFAISGATDAFAGALNQHTLNINDNDFGPNVAGTSTVLSEDFESGGAGWTVANAVGNNQWAIGGTAGAMNGTRSSYVSRNGGGNNQYQANNTSFSRLVSPAINAIGVNNMTLSFDFHSNGEINGGNLFDYGALSYSLDGTNFINIIGSAAASPFQGVIANTNYTTALPAACNNTTFYLGFDWTNDNSVGGNPAFAVDDISVTAPSAIPVETTLNATNTEYLGPNSTVYWYDQTSGDVMVMINNTTAHDYGCTQVEVDRSGNGASLYMDASMNYACTDKSFLITPTTNNTAGAYDARLYFSQAEVAGWEAATGQLRSAMTIAKTNGAIANITPATPNANGPGNVYGLNPTQGVFAASDFFVEAQFATGFSGLAGGVENTTPFAVEFIALNALWENENAALSWEVGEFENLKTFVVERSMDGNAFQRLGEVVPDVANGNAGQFEYLDKGAYALNSALLNYRIRAVDFNGGQTISEVATLRPGQRIGLEAWPNPLQESLSIRIDLVENTALSIELFNAIGQKVVGTTFDGLAGANQVSMDLQHNLSAGVYMLRVKGDGFLETKRLLKE